jgi:predicted secreted protein
MLTALLVALSFANAAPATKTLTAADSGRTVTLTSHQGLHIELAECGSCGYSWKTTTKPDPTVLTQRPATHKDPTCTAPCTGGSDTVVFRYVGKAKGRTTLRLAYFGPGQRKPAKTFRLTVRVS